MSQCTHTQMGVLWHAKLGTSLQIACSLHSCSGLHDGHLKLEKDARPDPTKHSAWREHRNAEEPGPRRDGRQGKTNQSPTTRAALAHNPSNTTPRHRFQATGQRQTTTKRPQDSMTIHPKLPRHHMASQPGKRAQVRISHRNSNTTTITAKRPAKRTNHDKRRSTSITPLSPGMHMELNRNKITGDGQHSKRLLLR